MISVLRKLWGVVVGFSKAAPRRAAELGDGWIADLHTFDEIRRLVAEVRRIRADFERVEDTFRVFGSVTDIGDLDGYRRLEDAGVTHLVTFPWVLYSGFTDSLQEKLDGIARSGTTSFLHSDECASSAAARPLSSFSGCIRW